jgi:hypothetical protein
MSWHYSQALEAAFSEASSLDGERSVQLRSTGTDGIAFSHARIDSLSFMAFPLVELARLNPTPVRECAGTRNTRP